MIFFWEESIPFHHTTLDTYGASFPPYWNPKYAIGSKCFLPQTCILV